MRYNRLGNTDINVSEICLGTMTWGTQNDQKDANEQMAYALDHGVNFIDTAEMYPTTPLSAETAGDTERIIGEWVRTSGRRNEVIIATKVCGKGYPNIRDGAPISKTTIEGAVDASLKRLNCDTIDLYQLHWPNRGSYHFRQSWTYDPSTQDTNQARDEILEALTTLDALINAGKIRSIGLSNESAWGTLQFLSLAAEHNLPRVVSIQNEYSLLDRKYNLDMAEVSHHENVGCLAWSPLCAGLLSGKYRNDVIPEGSRMTITPDMRGRVNDYVIPVVEQYCAVADSHRIDPAQMAIAFCCSRPFMTATIIGATTLDQLENDIAAADLTLNEAVLSDLAAIHRRHPNPQG